MRGPEAVVMLVLVSPLCPYLVLQVPMLLVPSVDEGILPWFLWPDTEEPKVKQTAISCVWYPNDENLPSLLQTHSESTLQCVR